MSILGIYMNDSILKSNYKFSGSGIYFSPPPGSFQVGSWACVQNPVLLSPFHFFVVTYTAVKRIWRCPVAAESSFDKVLHRTHLLADWSIRPIPALTFRRGQSSAMLVGANV